MKTKITITFIVFGMMVAMAVLGQTTYTWTGAGDGTNFSNTNNWSPNGVPSSGTGDTAEWNGGATNMVTNANGAQMIFFGQDGVPGSGFDSLGVNLVVTANQALALDIDAENGGIGNIGLHTISIASNAPAFTLGGNSGGLPIVSRPAGGPLIFVNDSTNPATIMPNLLWQGGGGVPYTLEFDGTGNWVVTNYMATFDEGISIEQVGSGVLYWSAGTDPATAGESYIFSLAISNGMVVMESADVFNYYLAEPGDVDVDGGEVEANSGGTNNDLIVRGNLNISSGVVAITLNKALPATNSVFSVIGNINYTGGFLKLLNVGPALTVGDTFTIFSNAVPVGASMAILSPGFTVTNNLAVNGSVTVTTVTTLTPEITAAMANGQLNLTWPSAWSGLHLEALTNPTGGGLNTANWVTLSGTDTNNTYAVIINPEDNVFYRLAP